MARTAALPGQVHQVRRSRLKTMVTPSRQTTDIPPSLIEWSAPPRMISTLATTGFFLVELTASLYVACVINKCELTGDEILSGIE